MASNISRLTLVVLFSFFAMISSVRAGQTELAEPVPSFDEPRKIILQLSSSDPKKMNNILFNAVNLQKFYGMDNVRIRIVAFGPGMKALYKKNSPVRERIQSLLKYEIEFVGCGNTMNTTQHTPADLISGVEWKRIGLELDSMVMSMLDY